jgi:thioredoxin-related protein
MKNLLIILFFVLSYSAFGQTWLTNFDEAKQLSAANNQNIVLVFKGSDWCAPCIKLDKEILSTDVFQKLAQNHFIMMEADFPRKKTNKLSTELTAHNAKLAELYNNQGYFPLVVLLNSKGEVLGKLGYEKTSVSDYFKKLTAFEL